MPQTKINYEWTPLPNGEVISGPKLITHDGGQQMDFAVAGGSTNLALDFNSLAAARVGLLFICDRDLTVKVNSTTEPDATLNLLAGMPLTWAGVGTSPITADISSLYTTLSAGADAVLKVRTLENTLAPA